MGIDCSTDVLSLRAGDRWETQLHRLIDEADIFLLFWSASARQSEWVEREWRYALGLGREHFIHPVTLEMPPPSPPPELAHLHFMDSLAYFIQPERNV
jgi:hypothetical protein